MDPLEAFDHDAAGNIITKPLLGFTSVPVAGMALVVRMEYADTEPRFRAIMSGSEKADAVQFILTPDQARKVAQRLNYLADMIVSQQTPDVKTMS